MSDADTRTPFPDRTPDPDAGPSALAVYVAFCADLPDRTGESAAFPDLGLVRILGRCVAATDEVPVEFSPWHPVVSRKPLSTSSSRRCRRTAVRAPPGSWVRGCLRLP